MTFALQHQHVPTNTMEAQKQEWRSSVTFHPLLFTSLRLSLVGSSEAFRANLRSPTPPYFPLTLTLSFQCVISTGPDTQSSVDTHTLKIHSDTSSLQPDANLLNHEELNVPLSCLWDNRLVKFSAQSRFNTALQAARSSLAPSPPHPTPGKYHPPFTLLPLSLLLLGFARLVQESNQDHSCPNASFLVVAPSPGLRHAGRLCWGQVGLG